MASQLERCIQTIIDVFHEHSVKQGDRDTLSQREFKELVKKDLQNFLKKEKRNEKLIKDIMEDLDTNQDKMLSFEEFVVLIAKLTFASHEEMHKNAPPGHGHSHGPGLGEGGRGRGQGPSP